MKINKTEILPQESQITNTNPVKSLSGKISRRAFFFGSVAAVLPGALYRKKTDTLLASRVGRTGLATQKKPVIDIHRHCMWKPSNLEEKLMEKILKMKIHWRDYSSYSTISVNGISSIAYHELDNIDVQVQMQDEASVTMSILSFSMELELISKELLISDNVLTQRANDALAAMVAKYPGKLAFMAMVNPFRQDSINECERCIYHMGAKGISIGTSWKGQFLDSPDLYPFWEYVQARDITIFLHPPLLPIGYNQMNLYRLEEVVGRPFDTAMTVTRMIYSGVFDRYPRLKIVLPHMGGGLMSVIGRLDFGYRLGYEGLPQGQAAVCANKPSDYLKKNIYVDIMGFSPEGIRHCLELFGSERVLFGTDFPAVNINQKEHIDIIKALGLSWEDEDNIFWKNAKGLFRLDVD